MADALFGDAAPLSPQSWRHAKVIVLTNVNGILPPLSCNASAVKIYKKEHCENDGDTVKPVSHLSAWTSLTNKVAEAKLTRHREQ